LIKLAASFYLGQPLDMFQRIVIGTASITTLHLQENHAAVVNLNFSSTFQLPQPPKKRKGKKNGKG
jgi:hypothetical protein